MRNDIPANLRRVALILTGLLAILFLYISFIQIFEGNQLTAHPLNRRATEAARRVPRGEILDRHGDKLAYSERDSEGTYHREYPYGAIFAHLVGYDNPKYGKAGLEGTFNGELSGLTHPERHLGAIVRLWGPIPGNHLVLTVDRALQQAAYQALGGHRGAVVVIDPRTGAILAMVSKPAFNPNTLDRDWEKITSSADSPLLNRATQGLYPPGSTVKIMIAEAALREKITDINKVFKCDGKLKIGPDYVLNEASLRAHGRVNLEEALAVSCNVTFGSLALELGRTRMANLFERYGFTRSIGEEWQESPVRLPVFSRLGDGDLAQTGIGQGSLLVTPLRMALIAAAFANNGKIMKPYVVEKIVAADGTVINEFKPSEWLTPVEPNLAKVVGQMMVTVVAEGTGSAARIGGIKVAGKTGTAENPHGAPHAWFIGYAPADNPEIAVAVLVENGGAGGEVAAPIARQIIAHQLY
ncbi:Peptidoglycan glycosyltransferase [Thermosinus carboxydivorans Nor1]|uniref:Peptidoglycan glycosyltransferase n=1 Tax=Thermosinus carboxydivorans Nor1 TaxID=401526 RepID=A1HMW8_9FIRM|nr:penicillin-binding transpeptidase domain-containing protein [Thermosinus carboxydivorans]EAX48600.1 Peptidoglycan glycosyltransferase [Thermosinus carboxydivorans Nor1]